MWILNFELSKLIYLGLLSFECGGKGAFPPPRKLGELPPGKFGYLEREGTFVKQ